MDLRLSRPTKSAAMYEIPETFEDGGGSDAAWDRLASVLGDLDAIDEDVLTRLLNRFTLSDMVRVERAKWYARLSSRGLLSKPHDSANQRVWIVSPSDRGPFGMEYDEYEVFADNLETILAGLVSYCVDQAHFPTRIDVVGASIFMEFDGADMLVVKPWQRPAATVDDVMASRLCGTLCGLTGDDKHAAEELVERIHRLPGWKGVDVVMDPETADRCDDVRFGFFKEWRDSARHLIEAAGINASSGMVDKLLCAIFDVPSWHHLTGALHALNESGCGSDLWQWSFAVEGATVTKTVFGSAVEAFNKTLDSARSLVELQDGDNTLTMMIQQTHGSVDCISMGAGVLDVRESDRGVVSMRQVWVMYAGEGKEPRVAKYVSQFFERGDPLTEKTLRRLLLLDLTPDEREAMCASLAGDSEVARSGTYRFAVRSRGTSKDLHAHEIDGDGRRIDGYSHGVERDAGALLYEPDLKAYVLAKRLFREGPLRPVAVMDDLSEDVVRAVRACLDPTTHTEFEGLRAKLKGTELQAWRKSVKQLVKRLAERRRSDARRRKASVKGKDSLAV